MSNWLAEDMKEAQKDEGQLPNPKAPRLVKETKVEKVKNKKPVLLKIDEDVHKQLSRLTNLRKISGNESATVTSIFIEGLDLYLKKHKLPSLDELENGAEIQESDVK
jgi:hypothetical protein